MNAVALRRVAYCLASYPVLREYFNQLEIEGLRDEGWDVHVFTFVERSVTGTDEWPVRWDRVHRGTWNSPHTWAKAVREVVRQPLTVLRLIALAARRLWRSPVNFAKSVAALVSALALAAVVRGHDIRLIHAAWCVYPGWIGLALRRLCPDRRFTVGCYAYDYDARFPLTVDMVREADLVFTHSEARAREIREVWPRTSRPVTSVYRGVELGEIPPECTRNGIVAVGGLERHKGLDVLIEALGRMSSHRRSCGLTIVGGSVDGQPDVERELRALATRLGLADQIRFTGPVPHSRVLEIVSRAEVFCLPSLFNDVLPNAAKEAMALEVPVVVTDTVGISELVEDGITGRVVPRGDPTALAESLEWVLEHPVEAAKLAAVGKQRLIAKFDIRRTSARRSQLFTDLLNQMPFN